MEKDYECCDEVKKETASDIILKIKNAVMDTKDILGINYPSTLGSNTPVESSKVKMEISNLKFILENLYDINDELKSL